MAAPPAPVYQQFNPFPPQEKPGYDILLSLSQKQLQRQLDVLYAKPLPSSSLPPPGSAKSSVTEKYLIDHHMRLLLPRSSRKSPQRVFPDDEREGILGHILCPEIVLIPGKYRTVQLKFTFTSVTEEAVQQPYSTDSVLQQLDEGEIYPVVINGWSFSFEADLSTSAPMNIMNDILKLADDPTNHVVLPEKTREKFQELADITAKPKAVDSRTFLASSIFCLFQSTQIANTFRLTNEKGFTLKPEDFNTIKTFSETITTYFTTLKNSELPTTRNPFVLGYTITQTIPQLSDVTGPATVDKKPPTTDKTPKYFIPRRYDIAVTPSPGGVEIPGTINFCLQTFRDDEKDQVDVDIMKTPNSGISYYTPQQNIVPGGTSTIHDGVMLVSKKLFLETFVVQAFNPAFFLDPKTILESLGCDRISDSDGNAEYLLDDKPIWERTHSVSGNTLESRQNAAQVLYQIPKCASRMTIECSSDWSNAVDSKKEGDFKSDSKRETYLTIITEAITTIEHKGQANLESGETGDFGAMGRSGSIEDLPLMHKVVATQRYKYVYKLAAGKAGAWDIQLDDKLTVQPTLKNNNTELDWKRVEMPPGSAAYGTFVQVTKGAVQGLVEGWFDLDKISQNRAISDIKSVKSAADQVLSKVTALSDTFKMTIMLPAGDLFEFVGLDTDKFGNLYSNINYATPQSGSTIQRPLN